MSRKALEKVIKVVTFIIMAISFLPLIISPAQADTYTYTTDADFDKGDLINVVHDPSDQLQLDKKTSAFNFIWVAVSSKGTIVKINTRTNQIVGEYKTAPDGMGKDPSRTTVDANGNVWVANRAESGWVPSEGQYMGSVTYIGSPDTIWIDRNGNGVCDTSTGLDDVKPWTNANGADTYGGTSTAEDECIIHYVRVHSIGTRHLSVNKDNDVWVSGTGYRNFDLIDVETGKIIRTESSINCGGYGGLLDKNGVIWSSTSGSLLRWDTSLPLSSGTCLSLGDYSYGLGIDSDENIWNTSLYNNKIWKLAPNGTLLGTYSHGNYYAQGCVADKKGHIWVAHSILGPSSTVGHILKNGTYIGNVFLENEAGPTGVAVDADGYIWATGYYSQKVYKIDPTKGNIGADGLTPIGEVVWTSPNLGGNLYNYSDMTGSTVIAPPNKGTWTVITDSQDPGAEWGKINWSCYTPGDSSIVVSVASSDDPSNFDSLVPVTNGQELPNTGQYLKIEVAFTRSSQDSDGDGIKDSPILYDLTVMTNEPPDCSKAYADPNCLWSPNHQMVPVNILGVTDPDGDPLTITITAITSDEPTASDKGSGGAKHAPDAEGIGSSTALLRAERSGNRNGRVYEITFTASDGKGGECEGKVKVKVPHDQSGPCTAIDDGQNYDATKIN
ncbi:MAG: hypothetical protein K6U11_07665 [bacterium]|nr:hypothetical protein [bacterium]